jgi:hypothetical protein
LKRKCDGFPILIVGVAAGNNEPRTAGAGSIISDCSGGSVSKCSSCSGELNSSLTAVGIAIGDKSGVAVSTIGSTITVCTIAGVVYTSSVIVAVVCTVLCFTVYSLVSVITEAFIVGHTNSSVIAASRTFD